MIRLLFVLLLLAPGLARAVEPRERLADPALEARARDISRTLRCLVCQNELIDEFECRFGEGHPRAAARAAGGRRQ